MKLSDLKAVCAAYLNRPTSDLTVNGVDLFVIAANNVRKKAEKLHNFEHARMAATLLIDSVSGTPISSAVGLSSGFSGIKEIESVSVQRPNGIVAPVDFRSVGTSIELDRYELELSDAFYPDIRYPSDAQILNRRGSLTVVQRGGTLLIFPRSVVSITSPITVYLEGWGWLVDYSIEGVVAPEDPDDPDAVPNLQDFFQLYGSEYLQWGIIVELNQLFKEFVPRQEGNLSPPNDLKESAWKDLLLWDSYQVESHTTRSR